MRTVIVLTVFILFVDGKNIFLYRFNWLDYYLSEKYLILNHSHLASSHLEEICKNINSAQNGEIFGERTPSPIEVNSCIGWYILWYNYFVCRYVKYRSIADLKKSLKVTCTFDVSTCDTRCLYGYESDEANCPISCSCKFEGLFEGDIRFTRDDIPALIEVRKIDKT